MYTMRNGKEEEIQSALSQSNVWKLRDLCISEGGLLNDSFRQQAWPLLVGLDTITTSNKESVPRKVVVYPWSQSPSEKEKERCIDYDQIGLDVSRCTWHLVPNYHLQTNVPLHKLQQQQHRLQTVLNTVFCAAPSLRYYQGYHDISSIFLSTLGGAKEESTNDDEIQETEQNDTENASTDGGDGDGGDLSFTTVQKEELINDLSFAAVSKEKLSNDDKMQETNVCDSSNSVKEDIACRVLLQVSQTHLKDSLGCNFQKLSCALRTFIMPLLHALDIEIYHKLHGVQMEPFFCLSWIITWFSHDVRSTPLVKRLFDFFIASHPLMPLYTSIAMVLHKHNRTEILSCDGDFASIHCALSQLPRNSCSVGYKLIWNQHDSNYISDDDNNNDNDDDGEANDEDDAAWEKGDASIMCDEGTLEGRENTNDDDDEGSNAPSLASSSCDLNRVPFEDLIELSIEFMRRIPPRKLIALAQMHNDTSIQPYLKDASSITLLQAPPSFNSTSTNPNLLLEQALQRETMTKKKQQDGNANKQQQQEEEEEISLRALICAGNGPDGDGELRLAQKRRKLKYIGAVMVAVVAIGYQSILLSSNPKMIATN